jgi:glycine/D-amino acid oxidase-like deaminating enzyme
MPRGPKVVVIGAGAFGGWTALELAGRGADVTVIDAWGPGNVRASSGGETRVIRASYGTRTHYTRLVLRALERWREFEARVRRTVFHRTGVLWLFDGSEDAQAFARSSAEALRAHGVPMQDLTPLDAAHRYPQIDFTSVSSVMFEPEAGYLLARRACEYAIEPMLAEGGVYRLAAARSPADADSLRSKRLWLVDATTVEADLFVFACGPWLGRMFPDVVGNRVISTRQEVYYFGPPAGDRRFTEPDMPAWIDLGLKQLYGIPGNAHRGFKLADDSAGPEMDPTTSERDVTASGVAEARRFLARRFPDLGSAPLVGSEVCQYEASPDSDLIIDRHPAAENVWLVGGGSGHGFKMAPAVGELVASLALAETSPDPRFALARFAGPPAEGWQAKWT